MRIGVIGLGKMGYHHVRVLNELVSEGMVDGVIVYDIDNARASLVKQRFNVVLCNTFNCILDNRLDAAVVSTPTVTHYEVAAKLLERNISVLVEKPITSSIDEAIELIKLADSRGLLLMVGHIERFNPAVEKLRQIISSNILGEVVSVTARRVGPLPPRDPDTGVVVDLAVHDIDVMRFVLSSEPIEVYARLRSARLRSGFEDFAILDMLFNNGSFGLIETNWITPHKVRQLTVVGTKAVASLDYIRQTLVIYDEEWIREAKVDKEEPLRRELIDFINSIKTGRKPRVTGEDGLKALVVALKALESSRLGRPVKVEYPLI